ncbi:MAG: flavodoxin [Tenericutes bacterium]|jgi:flavodoxin|nr:flavodoxin [Mycoplasmatota bacterium]
MKKAIIYYSKTGNTESVVKKFENVDLLEVKSESNDPYQKKVNLTETPDIKGYEHIIFASPVHAFQNCRVMQAYLNQLEDLKGITIDTFVTHQFRFSWLGGLQALKQMRKTIESKGGEVRYHKSINWKSHKREQDIQEMIELY